MSETLDCFLKYSNKSTKAKLRSVNAPRTIALILVITFLTGDNATERPNGYFYVVAVQPGNRPHRLAEFGLPA
jgi:hypothetical protein